MCDCGKLKLEQRKKTPHLQTKKSCCFFLNGISRYSFIQIRLQLYLSSPAAHSHKSGEGRYPVPAPHSHSLSMLGLGEGTHLSYSPHQRCPAFGTYPKHMAKHRLGNCLPSSNCLPVDTETAELGSKLSIAISAKESKSLL